MEVKTESGGSFDAAGKGTTGLSIAGLVTGATALVGGGLLGMLGNGMNGWGFNRGAGCGCGSFVSDKEFNLQKGVDALSSELAKEKAERYADKAVINGNDRLYNFRKDIADAIVDDRTRISNLEAANRCLEKELALTQKIYDQKIEAVKHDAMGAIALESERRCNGDQNVYNWAKATFVPGELIMPASSICPSVMPRFNSYVAPTTPAPDAA